MSFYSLVLRCQGLRCATHGCLEEFAEINPDEFASVEERVAVTSLNAST